MWSFLVAPIYQQSSWFHVHLRLNSIPLYISVVGHLDCFHFLAIVNRAAKNMAEQVYVKCFLSPLDRCQRVTYINHRSYVRDLVLAVSEFSTLISRVTGRVCHRTNREWVSPFPSTPFSIRSWLVRSLIFVILVRVKRNLTVVLVCIYLLSMDDEHFLKHFLKLFFWEISVQVSGLFLDGLFF